MNNVLTLLLSSLLLAATSEGHLSSDYAFYDEDSLTFIEDINLYHDLGYMQPKQAILKKEDADHVHFHPQTKHIHLLPQEGETVLFWHKEQNLQLNAQEIVMISD